MVKALQKLWEGEVWSPGRCCCCSKAVLLSLQMKTVSVALVLCLNVGVDPPDVVKTTPCARLECWIGECPEPQAPLVSQTQNPSQTMHSQGLKLGGAEGNVGSDFSLG